jgi:flagellar assembly protein FliH
MSTSKLITKESLTAFERWELPAVGAPLQPRSEEITADSLRGVSAERLEEVRQAAYKEGFEQGHREGLKSGQQEAQARVQRLAQILAAMSEPLDAMDAQVEEELTALAIAIARQLVRREIHTEPGIIIAVVREAVAALPSHARRVQIHLHPEDAALVREQLAPRESDEPTWKVIEDPMLTRGGCKVVTEHSRIDATVEKRLAAAITQVLGGERDDDGAR